MGAFVDFEQMSDTLRFKHLLKRGFRATDISIVLANRAMAVEMKGKGVNSSRHNLEVEPMSLKDGLVKGKREREESWMSWIPSPT